MKCRLNPFAKMLFVLYVVTYSVGFAQFDSLGLNTAWNKGVIFLNDDSKLNGFIQNNERLGLIKFKQTLDQTEELSFQEKRILRMEYFDSDISKTRKFYALDVKDHSSGFQGKVLFEIIMECKGFAVLSKKSNVQQAVRGRGNEYESNSRAKVGYEQLENIFLIGENPEAELLQTTSSFERDKGKIFSMPIAPFFNKELLKKFVGNAWNDVNLYVKNNRLDLKKKADLLSVLEFYQQWENKKG